MTILLFVSLSAVGIINAGCNNTSVKKVQIENEQLLGSKQNADRYTLTYDKSYDVVWFTVLQAVRAIGLKPYLVSYETGMVMVKNNTNRTESRGLIGIYVSTVDGGGRTRIEMIGQDTPLGRAEIGGWIVRLTKLFHEDLSP